MADLRKLAIAIGFKPDEASLKRVEGGVKKIRGLMVAVSAVAAVAGAGLFGIANSVAQIGDEARKTAQSLGLTTESLQELAFAADLSGVSQSDFFNSLRKLTKTAADAADGMLTYKKEFDKLGISVTGTNGELKSSEELMLEIAEAISKMPDSAEKTAIALNLFGRSGAKLIPLLNAGKEGIQEMREEAIGLGGVMSDETAKSNEEFIDSIARVKFVLRGLKFIIAEDLIPLFTSVFTRVKDWALANRELIKTKISSFVSTLVKFLKFWLAILGGIFKSIMSLINALGGLEKVLIFVVRVMAAFLALQFASAIGNVVIGVISLAKAFTAVKVSAIQAQLAAIGLPLLIGAAVIALGLIIDDIIAFFQGRDSVTAVLVDAFREKFPSAFAVASAALSGLIALFSGLFDVVKGLAKILLGIFTFDLGLIAEGAGGIFDVFDNLINDILGLFKGKLVDGIKNALSFGKNAIASLGEFFGIGEKIDEKALDKALRAPSIIPVGLPPAPGIIPTGIQQPSINNSTTGSSVSLQVSKVEVIVPPDTPADQASSTATGIFEGKIQDMLKNAAADAEPEVAL